MLIISANINKLSEDQFFWAVKYVEDADEDDYEIDGIPTIVKAQGDLEFSRQRASRRMTNCIRALIRDEKKRAIPKNKLL